MQRVIWMAPGEARCPESTKCPRRNGCARALVPADGSRPVGSYWPTVVMGNPYCTGWMDAAQCVAPAVGPRVHEAVKGLACTNQARDGGKCAA